MATASATKCIPTTFDDKHNGNMYSVKLYPNRNKERVGEILEVDPVFGVRYNNQVWTYKAENWKMVILDSNSTTKEHARVPVPLIFDTQLVYTGNTMTLAWQEPAEGSGQPGNRTGILIMTACDHTPCNTYRGTQRIHVKCCQDVLRTISSTMMQPVLMHIGLKVHVPGQETQESQECRITKEFKPGCLRYGNAANQAGAFEFKAQPNAGWYCMIDESELAPFTFESFKIIESHTVQQTYVPRSVKHIPTLEIKWIQEKDDDPGNEILTTMTENKTSLTNLLCVDGENIPCPITIFEPVSDVVKRSASNSGLALARSESVPILDPNSREVQGFANFLALQDAHVFSDLKFCKVLDVLRFANKFGLQKLLGAGMTKILRQTDPNWFKPEDLINLYTFLRTQPEDVELTRQLKGKVMATMKTILQNDRELFVSLMKNNDNLPILNDWVAEISRNLHSD